MMQLNGFSEHKTLKIFLVQKLNSPRKLGKRELSKVQNISERDLARLSRAEQS